MRAGERRDDSACLNVPHSAVPRPHPQPLISFTLPIRTQHPLSLSLSLSLPFSLSLSLHLFLPLSLLRPLALTLHLCFFFFVFVFLFLPFFPSSLPSVLYPSPPPIHLHSLPPTHAFLRPAHWRPATARTLAFPLFHRLSHPFRASSWLSRASDRPRFFLFFVAHTAFARDHFVLHGSTRGGNKRT